VGTFSGEINKGRVDEAVVEFRTRSAVEELANLLS